MPLTYVVSSLPIRPRNNPSIGFYSIPTLLDVIAKINDSPLVYGVNLLGVNKTIDNSYSEHLRHLDLLKINPDSIINDREILPFVKSCFLRGYSEGWILRANRNVYSCPCGKTEFLCTEENLLSRMNQRLVYKLVDGKPFCKLCGKYASQFHKSVYLLQIPQNSLQGVDSHCLQPYFSKDVKSQIEFFRGKELLISRTLNKGIVCTHQGSEVFLDTDFVFMLYFHFLYTQKLCVEILPVGCKMAKHLVLALVVSELLQVPTPQTIISLPYFQMPETDANVSINDFGEKYGFDILRVLLSFAFGSNKKDLNIQSHLIHQILVSSKFDIQSAGVKLSVKEFESFWKNSSPNKTMKLISQMRKKPGVTTDLDRKLLSIMFKGE